MATWPSSLHFHVFKPHLPLLSRKPLLKSRPPFSLMWIILLLPQQPPVSPSASCLSCAQPHTPVLQPEGLGAQPSAEIERTLWGLDLLLE